MPTDGWNPAAKLMLLGITRVGEQRWRELGLDIDGRHPPEDA